MRSSYFIAGIFICLFPVAEQSFAGASINESTQPPNSDSQTSEPSAEDEDPGMPIWWKGPWEREAYISVGCLREPESGGEDVYGVRFAYGIRGSTDDHLVWSEVWVAARDAKEQTVVGFGAEVVPFAAYRTWGAIGPVIDLGVEHREIGPHRGFGGFFGLGVEGSLWLGRHWQLVLAGERDFGIGSATRNQVRLSIGYAHRRIPLPNEEDHDEDI
jgi:hypothetical protein